MSAQFWVSNVNSPAATADGAAYASSNSLTDVTPAPQYTVNANTLYPGQIWRVRAWGRHSSASAPTLTMGVYWNGVAGTAIATTGALTDFNPTNQTWELDFTFVCRTVGTSGTVMGTGHVMGITSATAVNMIPATAPATATINTTTSNILTVGALWSANSASNTLTLHVVSIELLN